ncbi:GntR family transcriptional regulator [Collinsella sp. TM05-37]|uniref:GntR family transcriptional regulator n=1 Tax=Collinsella sp. TM05-37 TaxID=2292340 RepID=UPI001314C97A|nr:GntR family transcriptional regulator [Collinsella sp. TM05-37]
MDMISFLASEPFDRSGDTPLYVQLKHRIALLIASQAFDTKTPLPRELEICERLELSRATVRRCFQDLVIEGRVVRKRGQGTFIKPQTSAPGIDLALNFSARMREAGRVPSSQILAFSSIPAVRGIASGLKVPEGTPVWEIRRLRLANDKPMELNYVYIPVSLCPELTRKDVDGSLYAYIAEKTGILPASVDAVYETVNLDKHEARLLGQNAGKAAMRIVRSTYDKTGTPFEVGVLISCDGQAKLHVHIAADKTTFTATAQ